MINFRKKLLKPILALGVIAITSCSCTAMPPNAATQSMQPSQVKPINSKEPAKPIIRDISELKDKLDCSNRGDTLVYAETENYKISVCSDIKKREVPAFMKIVKKDGSLKIEGNSQLGWKEDSFVGINEKHGYRLMMPSPNEFYLSIVSGTEFKPLWSREDIQLYYTINQFSQTKEVDELDSNSTDKSKRMEFINYIVKNREKLNVCGSFFDKRLPFTRLWKVTDKKYLLMLSCWLGASAINATFLLISETESGYRYKLLNIPTIARHRESGDNYGKPIIGEDGHVALTDIPVYSIAVRESFYKSGERTLRIYMGKGSCGELRKYRIDIDNNNLDLIEHRASGSKICDDLRYAADPILLPIIPLQHPK
jgi:hypothetical protein